MPRLREGYYVLNQQEKAELVAKLSAFLSCRAEIFFSFRVISGKLFF